MIHSFCFDGLRVILILCQEIAEDLDRRGIRQLGWFVPYGVGTLGNNPRRAHNITLEQERRERHGSHYWFNRACYASLYGEFADATHSLATCFTWKDHFCTDAFLDPDLIPLWQNLASLPMDVPTAEFFMAGDWEFACRYWNQNKENIVVPLKCWEMLPGHLRHHIPKCANGPGLKPADSMSAALRGEYVDWLSSESSKNWQLLVGILECASDFLLDRQAVFAIEQGIAGNLTAARWHLIRHLSYFPDRPLPDQLMRDANLGPLADDLRDALAEDPDFPMKIVALHQLDRGQNADLEDDTIAAISEAGRETILFSLRVAARETRRGRYAAALEIYGKAMNAWPLDAAISCNAIECAAHIGKWDLAKNILEKSPHYRRDYRLSDIHQSWIEAQSAEIPYPKCATFVGQRDLGGHLRPKAVDKAGILDPETIWQVADPRTSPIGQKRRIDLRWQ